MLGIRNYFVLWVVVVVMPAHGSIWYVDDDAPGGGNGESWGSAFSRLEPALAAAQNGDEIRVAGGIYRPLSQTGFILASRAVALNGGYAGLADSANPDRRDISVFGTTLSGDINGDDDESGEYYGDNAAYTLRLSGYGFDRLCVVSGMQITAGYSFGVSLDGWSAIEDCEIRANRNGIVVFAGALGPPQMRRARISESRINAGQLSGEIEMVDCIISDNAVGLTGGGYCHATGCLFERNGNTSTNGGAIAVNNAFIDGCEFRDNRAAVGGAIHGAAVVTNSQFTRNSAQSGGAIAIVSGSNLSVTRCKFVSNSANGVLTSKGGAIWSDVASGITIRDSLFLSNFCAGDGGAISARSPTSITNCTFADNLAIFFGGAIQITSTGISSIGNGILWGNSSAFGSQCSVAQGELRIAFSNIQGGPAGAYADLGGRVLFGLGNLNIDPRFVSVATDDYRLAPDSPCIDAGLNAIVGSEFDLAGATRRIDDPESPDTGLGEPPLVDMGAYEFVPGPLPGDCIGNTDGDADIDLQDLATLLSHFGQVSGATVADGDTNGDGGVDLQDLANLLAHFGAPCP